MGKAIIIPNVDFSGKGFGTVTMGAAQAIPVVDFNIVAEDSYLRVQSFKPVIAYIPSNTTQAGVTWSIVEGTDYASIDALTGLVMLNDTEAHTIKIKAVSKHNALLQKEKSITVSLGSGYVPSTPDSGSGSGSSSGSGSGSGSGTTQNTGWMLGYYNIIDTSKAEFFTLELAVGTCFLHPYSIIPSGKVANRIGVYMQAGKTVNIYKMTKRTSTTEVSALPSDLANNKIATYTSTDAGWQKITIPQIDLSNEEIVLSGWYGTLNKSAGIGNGYRYYSNYSYTSGHSQGAPLYDLGYE